jgi:uncharacterized protein YndB with AHSA1/START domain
MPQLSSRQRPPQHSPGPANFRIEDFLNLGGRPLSRFSNHGIHSSIYIVSEDKTPVNELVTRQTIEVNAPVSTLWKILTDNEFIQQYMFGCYAETDWKPGSPLLWKGAADGKLYVKGRVVSIEPPHRLVYTVIDPNSAIADIPVNYLTMTYDLKERKGGGSVLEITQGDFAKVENGQNRYNDSLGGGDSILVAIKNLAAAQGKAK